MQFINYIPCIIALAAFYFSLIILLRESEVSAGNESRYAASVREVGIRNVIITFF